ncbi:hypothetical protein I5Q73_29025 [Pseudomonas aeruginosa]|uniref:hypothetical protein n=4 Tax=Pseudomonas aeruginosa TaxID=287 RepID=UPI001A34F408|nr:hypothetical protein [Pseudomonas aeruginosa]MBO8364671.1 hypothetical protein [Pseudomonas aeruginosa]MBO8364672.1 hypothetical protein [Pseudomonas aeruginosa]MBO8369000.1 hypothetical protein [Pseudomonas aeruginosa]BDG78231.1 hypothetical protein [Pseudomonas aeruginosa]
MRSEAQGEAVERGKVGAQLFRNSQKLFRGEPGNALQVTTLRRASERAQPPERVGEGNAMRGDGGAVERRLAGSPALRNSQKLFRLFRNSQKLFRGAPSNSAQVTTLRRASERAQPPERVGEGNAMRGDGGVVERRSAGAPLSGTAKSCSGSARPSSRQRGGPKQTEA